MKPLLYILLIFGYLTACTSTESYEVIRQEVLTEHDKVMGDSELAFRYKMKLDTLTLKLDSLKKVYAYLDTLKEKEQINELRNKLNKADDMMNDWMHKLEAEIGSKSNDEAVAYFKSEKMKINTIDSLYAQIIKQSDNYLSKFKK